MSQLSFSFPVSPKASFILERYLQEFEQRVLLKSAMMAANNAEDGVSEEHITLVLTEMFESNVNELRFFRDTICPLLKEEWKAKKPNNGEVESAKPGAVS